MHLEKIIEDLEAEDEVEGPPQSRIGKNSSKPARGRRFSLPPGVHLQDKMRGNPDTGIRVGSGTGLVNVGLQLTSEAKDKTVIFPAGLLLVPKDNNTQNGLLVQEVVIIIPAHSEQKWILQSYCANSNLSEAYKSDEFEFCLVLRESKYLEFFELLKGKTISDEAALTVQDAVWELTNRGFLERETLDRIREI